MSDAPLEERLAAVERALTDGEDTAPVLTAPDRDLVDRVGTLEEDVAELEAAVQAVRGYVGSVKHVNDEVEQRADAAMAKVEELERTAAREVDGGSDRRPGTDAQRTTVHGGDGVGTTVSEAGECPTCGADGSGPEQDPASPRESVDPVQTGGEPNGATDAEVGRAVERREGRTDGREREAGHAPSRVTAPDEGVPADGRTSGRPAGTGQGNAHSSAVDGGHEPGERPGSGGSQVGHRRLEATDEEEEGLVARLKGVL